MHMHQVGGGLPADGTGVTPPRLARGYVRACAAATVAAGLIAACASGTHHAAGSAAHVVDVTVENFKIDVPASVPAGLTRFVIHGAGPTMHEFNVTRTDLAPTALPLAADGTVDDTEPHPGVTHLAEAEGIDIGQTKDLTVMLTPGRYVLYCNMDGHYEAGMNAGLQVTA